MDSKDPNFQSSPNQDTPGTPSGTPTQSTSQAAVPQAPLEAQNNHHASDQPPMDNNAISAHDALKNQPAVETADPLTTQTQPIAPTPPQANKPLYPQPPQPSTSEPTALGSQSASSQGIQTPVPTQPQTTTEPSPEFTPVTPEPQEVSAPIPTSEMPAQQPTTQQNEQMQSPQPPGVPSVPNQPPQGGGDQQGSDILGEINKERKMSKLPMIIGIAVLILAMIAAVAYYALNQATPTPSPTTLPTPIITAAPVPTATPDPTANWMTYSNTNPGFSIKYPPDKQSVVDTLNVNFGLCGIDNGVVAIKMYAQDYTIPEIETEFSGDLVVTVGVVPIDLSLTVDEWIAGNCEGSWVVDPMKKEQVTINGVSATKLSGEGETHLGRSRMVTAQYNQNLYLIRGWSGNLEFVVDTLLNQILSTFQFTDSESTTSSSPSASLSASPVTTP